jgi:F0F1-type ATP synthase membrane subunit a
MFTLCVVGLVLSLLALFTTKPVSEFIAPKKESVLAIPRTIVSMFWLVFGPFVAIISALIFGLLLALLK